MSQTRLLCASCGIPFIYHDGLQGQCAQLHEAKARIATLEAESALLGKSYQEAHAALIAERQKSARLESDANCERIKRKCAEARTESAEAKLQRIMEWARDKSRCGVFCQSSAGLCGTCKTEGFESTDNWTPPKAWEV